MYLWSNRPWWQKFQGWKISYFGKIVKYFINNIQFDVFWLSKDYNFKVWMSLFRFLIITFQGRKTLKLTFTLRSIKCALIGGLDKRILQRLQVREFKDDWPLRPVGASRVTQVPQKCDLHSEHCFCKKLN